MSTATEIQLRIADAERRLHCFHGLLDKSFLRPLIRWQWHLQQAVLIQAEADLAFALLRADIERILKR